MSSRWILVVAWLLVAGSSAAAPGPPPTNYALERVSDAVAQASIDAITQLAFKPGDPVHLFAARSGSNAITRYDFDPLTGQLSNPVDVVTAITAPYGLAFQGEDLYASINLTSESRIARLRDANHDGLFEQRSEFVRGVARKDHGIDQLQIVGVTLFAAIGTRTNSGAPACESTGTGTIARIADLTLVDHGSGANFMPGAAEFLNSAPADGFLRRFAYGLRNPFGLRLDAAGRPWVSDNGASFCSSCSACNNFSTDTPDLFYREVPLGAKGRFPPSGFPGGGGATMSPFATLTTHAAAAGFDWIKTGPDAGRILLAQFGATDPGLPAGRNVVIVDPGNGNVTATISGFEGPTDVIADRYGRLFIADFAAPAVYMLTPPGVVGVEPLGRAPGGGPRIERLVADPAEGVVTVEYALPVAAEVTLRIADVTGREIARASEGVRGRGRQVWRWDAARGAAPLRSGIYFCRIDAGAGSVTRRFVWAR